MTKRPLPVLLLGLGLGVVQPAIAVNGSSIELGAGDESTRMARVTLRWNWDKQWKVGRNWNATGFWEAGLGHWSGDGAGAKSLWDLGFTPVFRLSPDGSGFFLEGAIGAHFLSETRISNKRGFGSSFNFGDHIGFGWTLGDKNRHELGYRFQHISNADIADPNDGINFHQIRLGFNY
jgi:hypothetical protein